MGESEVLVLVDEADTWHLAHEDLGLLCEDNVYAPDVTGEIQRREPYGDRHRDTADAPWCGTCLYRARETEDVPVRPQRTNAVRVSYEEMFGY